MFGDASGNKGTTSNAGEDDYAQMGQEFSDAECVYTVDSDQANPLVRNRVENFNALLRNALNETTVTYDPARCPLLDANLKKVGWKKNAATGKGKLDSRGDINLTHASDAAGYALWKVRPPHRRGTTPLRVASQAAKIRDAF